MNISLHITGHIYKSEYQRSVEKKVVDGTSYSRPTDMFEDLLPERCY